MQSLFPLFLKLKGRRCLVVGVGEIGEPKIASLLDAKGTVRVVGQAATGKVKEWARDGKIRWLKREFRDSDLDGCFMVIVATSSSELRKKIYRLARQRGVLCNVVDVPELCDFYYPALVRRGELQIAVSTGGKSPALAQRLRKELEAKFGPEYGDWLAELGVARKRIRAKTARRTSQKAQLHEVASEESFQKFLESRGK